MGYTHQHTQLLVGLGVSAISDAWYAFAQNVKTVEEYINLVDHDLPPAKGHILTRDDLILRRHISNLMCKGHTSWNQHVEFCEELFAITEWLHPLIEDGLVELNSWELKVTPLGKRFLRNICMALDARLWAKQPQSRIFSMAI